MGPPPPPTRGRGCCEMPQHGPEEARRGGGQPPRPPPPVRSGGEEVAARMKNHIFNFSSFSPQGTAIQLTDTQPAGQELKKLKCQRYLHQQTTSAGPAHTIAKRETLAMPSTKAVTILALCAVARQGLRGRARPPTWIATSATAASTTTRLSATHTPTPNLFVAKSFYYSLPE